VVVVPVTAEEASDKRRTFIQVVFQTVQEGGYLCVARRISGRGTFEERFFHWPDELDGAVDYINRSLIGHDIYFSPMLYDSPERRKERTLTCPVLWGDLDLCEPDHLLVAASVVIETSPQHYQAYWILDEPADPVDAQELSRRIAYRHHDRGADTTGWDLTQLLRIPYTYNSKYNPPPMVDIADIGPHTTVDEIRDSYPKVDEERFELWEIPEEREIPDKDTVLEKYRLTLPHHAWRLIETEPDADWSSSLWALESVLAESDLSREEIFSVARESACNKYRRDGRTDHMLWLETCKAWSMVHTRYGAVNGVADPRVLKNPKLLTDEDVRATANDRTFVDDYIAWAVTTGDAAPQYHQAGAFTALSSILSGMLQLPTSFGLMVPNLWFLLLADTTLTRKSTAMDMAVDMAMEVEDDVIMATDGSMEGMFSALSVRSGQPSIFLRDEFSGLLDSMQRKDYYAGMAEVLTKLYDGKFQKRQLRREVIEVREPVLLFLAGGTRARVLYLLNIEHVTSGFLPRFVIITAQSDITKLQPLKPPDRSVLDGRKALVDRLREIKQSFTGNLLVRAGQNGNSATYRLRNKLDVEMTDEAWNLYNAMELKLIASGFGHTDRDVMTPTMDRLAKSGLKAAMLIAASRRPAYPVKIDVPDIMKAFSYVTHWRDYAIDILTHIGITQTEHRINMVLHMVQLQPGINRGTLMRQFHLTAKDTDMIFETLAQRGQMKRTKKGLGEILEPVQ
jgi:hypothetical protein